MQEVAQLLGRVDISDDDYHAGPGISSSHLHLINEKSPLHYWDRYINPDYEPKPDTDAKRLGKACHAAILEPDTFKNNFIITPPFNRRTKEGRALYADFVEENSTAGKKIITPDDLKIALAVRDRVHTHPVLKGLLVGGKAEQSFYAIDNETGELIKCRFDYLHDDGSLAVDLKSTSDAAWIPFRKSITNYRYDVSAAWYIDVVRQLYDAVPDRWVWLAIETEPPYAGGFYYATKPQLTEAHKAAREDFLRIVQHKRMNHWPDYGYEALPGECMPWAKR